MACMLFSIHQNCIENRPTLLQQLFFSCHARSLVGDAAKRVSAAAASFGSSYPLNVGEEAVAGLPHRARFCLSCFVRPKRFCVVLSVKIHDPVKYADYRSMVPASLKKYGGEFIIRGAQTETLEGTWAPERLVVLKFPSKELAKKWWESPEYAPAKK